MRGEHLPGGSQTITRPFRTAFVRSSNSFFYEYREFWRGHRKPSAHGIVCANADGVKKWWSIRPRGYEGITLSKALSGFTGVSGGTAYAVPSLLLRDLGGRPTLPTASSARLTGEAEQDGHACYVLEGDRRGSVWIDQASMMLRRRDDHIVFDAAAHALSLQRMREYRDSLPPEESRDAIDIRIKDLEGNAAPGFATETTTTWRPEIDIVIDPSVFQFRPPDGGTEPEVASV
jgi:hypothetical protein